MTLIAARTWHSARLWTLGALLLCMACAEANPGASTGEPAQDAQDGTDSSGDGISDQDLPQDDASADVQEDTPPEPEALCEAGTTRCLDDRTNLLCEPGGTRETPFACPTETRCIEGVCQPITCTPGDTRCVSSTTLATCDEQGLDEVRTPCGAQEVCVDDACVARSCEPGARRCQDEDTALVCNDVGSLEVVEDCPDTHVCVDGTCLAQECEPGARRCANEDTLATCNENGLGESASPCAESEICHEGACVEQTCEPDSRRCLDVQTVLICDALGLVETPQSCPDSSFCERGSCISQVCEPNSVRCADLVSRLTCNELGTQEIISNCPDDSVCRDGECLEQVCSPGDTRCDDLLTLLTCDVDGTRELPSQCPDDTICDGDRCRAQVCEPGTTRCDGFQTLLTCQEPGLTEDASLCPDGQICEEGRCVFGCVPGERRCTDQTVEECADDRRTWLEAEFCDPEEGFACLLDQCVFSCENIVNKARYVGCDFFAADTPQETSGLALAFGIRVGNVSNVQTANVRVIGPDGETIFQEALAPGATTLFESPRDRPWNIREHGVSRQALRVITDVPVVAHQYSPVAAREGSILVGSADASLLFPVASLGNTYMAASWPGEGGFTTIISTANDNVVTITPTVRIAEANDLPAMEIDVPVQVTLQEGDVLTLRPDDSTEDITGTLIESVEPVSVFSGHQCAVIPDRCDFCDHIEEAVPPISAWGQEFVTAPVERRGWQNDYFRVIAAQNNTTLTFDPPLFDDIDPIDRGYFFSFSAREPFHLTASGPVMLVQYFKGSTCTSLNFGDPSMVIIPPIQRWLSDYLFEGPNFFENSTMAIGPEDATFRLNRNLFAFSNGDPIGESGYRVLYSAVEDGRQRMTSDTPFQTVVYGGAYNVSYGFCAGQDLSP